MSDLGLLTFILRSSHDYTNGGLSARVDKAVLIGEGLPEIFGPGADAPGLRLRRRGDYVYAEPVDRPEGELCGPMFGGNYLVSCDSRFGDAVGACGRPIPIHDRFETPELNRQLSV